MHWTYGSAAVSQLERPKRGPIMQREQLMGKLVRLEDDLRLRAGTNGRYASRVLAEVDATRASGAHPNAS
jgi:hypothetical protein